MKNLIRVFIFSLFSILSAGVYSSEKATYIQMRTLSPHIAHKIVLAALESCTKRGYKVSAAVVDRNGNLVAFLRHPLSGPHTIKVSQRKAFSSASLQVATSEVTSRRDLNFAPGILLIVGGVAIDVGGHFYGGAAVAGAEPKIDEKCAQAGVRAVEDIMNFGG